MRWFNYETNRAMEDADTISLSPQWGEGTRVRGGATQSIQYFLSPIRRCT